MAKITFAFRFVHGQKAEFLHGKFTLSRRLPRKRGIRGVRPFNAIIVVYLLIARVIRAANHHLSLLTFVKRNETI